MYNQDDMHRANALIRRYALILGMGLAVLLAAYIFAIFMGSQIFMLALALITFWFAAIESCVFLRPAVLYRKFLRDMNAGLRREITCTISSISTEILLKDGVRVYEIQVITDGGSRIFYINISKDIPPEGTHIRLTAYGRHIVQWEELPQ